MFNDKKELKAEETSATQQTVSTNDATTSNNPTETQGEEGTDWVRLESGLGIDE